MGEGTNFETEMIRKAVGSYDPDGQESDEARLLIEIRDSQLRTEALVEKFITDMGNNPMFKQLGKMFGGR